MSPFLMHVKGLKYSVSTEVFYPFSCLWNTNESNVCASGGKYVGRQIDTCSALNALALSLFNQHGQSLLPLGVCTFRIRSKVYMKI